MKKFILFLTILLCGCVSTKNRSVPNTELDAQLAVLKYAFGRYAESIERKEIGYFFLQVEDRDPSVEFLKNFSSRYPKVVGISWSKIDCGDYSGLNADIRHKVNGKAGVVVKLHKLNKISDTKYEVYFSSVRGCLGGGGFNGFVEFENGVWVVKKVENLWTS